MKKQRLNMRIICSVLLGLLLFPMLAGCSRIVRGETITVYPCYFNRDVEGVDGQVIRGILDDHADWELYTPEHPENSGPLYENSEIYVYWTGEAEASQRKGIIIHEFESAEQAEAVFLDNLTSYALAGEFTLEHSTYQMELRISNCVIMTVRNAHLNLLDMLELGEVRALQAYENTTHQSMRKPGSVEIDAVRTKMESDGYQFYASVLYAEDEEYSNTYVIVSPSQDRAYVFTQGQKPEGNISTVYVFAKLFCETQEIMVGMHVVDFKDGSSIICYGDSFEEIRAYFTEE